MKRRLLLALLLSTMPVVFSQQKAGASAQGVHNGTAASRPSTNSADEGERLFEVNCGRCHRPPDQISPKVAQSVLRHMRVRAMLSKEDEQQILKYLAP